MELWVRSQDREKFMKVDYFYLEQNSIIGYSQSTFTSPVLGKYKRKERALEVLDEIQSILRESPLVRGYFKYEYGSRLDNLEIKRYMKNVYEMPKE